ncbi:hypothetical protein [Aquimarina longa]|uniref:hypothetical protein n=1 Tax=Aquimarina longa TaxID=1080221 RepID=UPI0007810A8D|nr:hypothetical protein [Aquimarina longa]
MKTKLVLFFLISISTILNAQVENSNSLRIDAKNNNSSLSKRLNSTFDIGTSQYDTPNDLSTYGRSKPTINMTGDDGFFKPKVAVTPKWFKKDKEIRDEFKSDQYFGDFKNNGKFVRLMYRDHQSVDGDVVRIYSNDSVILSKAFLSGDFRGIAIDLVKGFNKIDIQALNQGESGPNTAQFQLYDDQGNLIMSNEWNLTTGVKATMIVVKE